jgi:hypothetical protein
VHTFSFDSPRVVSRGTDRENTPDSMYELQRVTISLRYPRALPSGGSKAVDSDESAGLDAGKNVSDSKLGMVDLKSGDVTSETNQGISFGLRTGIRLVLVKERHE